MGSPWRASYSRYKRLLYNAMSSHGKKRDLKSYLEIFLSLATIIIFAVFALRPTLNAIATLIKEIETKEEIIGRLDIKITNLEKARRVYDEEEERISLVLDAMPKYASPDDFFRQIENVSYENGTPVVSFSINETPLVGGGPVKREKSETFPQEIDFFSFSINLEADYPLLYDFLSTLQKLRRPVQIDSVNIQPRTRDQRKVLVLIARGKVPFIKGELVMDKE